jgi:hypothetical protein
MTENRKAGAGKPTPPAKPKPHDKAGARSQADVAKTNEEAPAGEELTGEGSPGLSIMGGGGHA